MPDRAPPPRDIVGARVVALLNPSLVFVLGAAGILLLVLVAPVDVSIAPLGGAAILYLGGSSVLFLVGTSLVAAPTAPAVAVVSAEQARWRLAIVFMGAVGGILLRTYDRYFLRGVDLANDLISNREALAQSTSSPVSIAAAILLPFCYLMPFVIHHSQLPKRNRRILHLLCAPLFIFPAMDSAVLGSRGVVLINIFLLMSYGFYFGVLRLNLRSIVATFGVGIAMAMLAAWMLLSRLSAMGLAVVLSAYESGYAALAQPDEDYVARLSALDPDGFEYLMRFTFLNISQYFVHGIFEFGRLVKNFDGIPTLGAFLFFIYAKIISLIPGVELRGLDQPGYRQGVYSTFFGPIFVDFMWFGPLALLLYGILSKILWRAAAGAPQRFAPLLFHNTIVIALMFVGNLIQGAEGIYFVTTFLIYAAVDAALARFEPWKSRS